MVPFAGDREAAGVVRSELCGLELGPCDEVVIADNSDGAVIVDDGEGAVIADGQSITVVRAAGERSSYHARNAGAAVTGGEWILFCDADCAPRPDLIERYFEPPPPARAGALAGAIVDHPEHDSLLARYAASRDFYRGDRGLAGRDGGYAPTGNLLVRRVAFERIGGFAEGIRSAGDVDLCWRLQAAGWTLGRRPGAVVAHRHREDLGSFLGMLARYGAGSAWLDRRHPGSSPRWPLSPLELARAGLDALRCAAGGDREEAVFRLVDALGLVAHNFGYLRSNRVGAERLADRALATTGREPRALET